MQIVCIMGHCHPVSFFASLQCRAYPGCPGKEAVKQKTVVCFCAASQKLKLSSVDFDSCLTPKPPTDPNRQRSRAGSRPRHNASDPHSPLSPSVGLARLKAESLNDGMSTLTRGRSF